MLVVVVINHANGLTDILTDTCQCEAERVDRTFQAFQQIGGHQFAQSLLPAVYGESFSFVVYRIGTLGTVKEIERRGIDGEVERIELLGYVAEIDGTVQVGKTRAA